MDENNITLNIDWRWALGIIGSIMFVPTILAWKFNGRFCTVETNIKNIGEKIKKAIENNLEPDLKDVRERFRGVEEKVDTLWKNTFSQANSPRQLNDRGIDVLNNSSMKEFIDINKDKLLELVKEKNPQNAYDAETAISLVMIDLLKSFPEMEETLKLDAFKTGSDVGAILFVGGIYLRNIIFEDLGFKLNELDKPKS